MQGVSWNRIKISLLGTQFPAITFHILNRSILNTNIINKITPINVISFYSLQFKAYSNLYCFHRNQLVDSFNLHQLFSMDFELNHQPVPW